MGDMHKDGVRGEKVQSEKERKETEQREKELVEKSMRGDCAAFEKLIAPYQQGIINHSYILLRNREDALDMAQEAMLRAFTGISGFSGQSSFKTWLYKIATNVCLDEIRRRKRRAQTVSLTVQVEDETNRQLDISDESANPEYCAEKSELKTFILDAIDELGEEYRSVMSLRELEGMDYAEIAKTLGVSLGTVKSRINRARQKLRQKLEMYKKYSEHM